MPESRPHTLLHGVVGGLAAGAVVALWFLVVDLVTSEPLHTPVLLARTILGTEATADLSPSRLALVYTVLHFGVFAFLGAAMAGFLAVIGVAPGMLLGAVFGVAVLSSVYYVTLLITGGNVLTVLPAIHVLGANFLGGVVLMAYLHRATRSGTDFGLGILRHHALLSEGIVVGLIGAVAVSVWFLLLDTLSGRPFYTPGALGSAVLLNASSPEEIQVSFGVVAAYTVVHLLAFAIVGVVLAWSAERLRRAPALWLVWLLAFIVVEGLFLGIAGIHGEWVMGALGYWAVGLGNLIGVAVMAWRLWARHRSLGQQLREAPEVAV